MAKYNQPSFTKADERRLGRRKKGWCVMRKHTALRYSSTCVAIAIVSRKNRNQIAIIKVNTQQLCNL